MNTVSRRNLLMYGAGVITISDHSRGEENIANKFSSVNFYNSGVKGFVAGTIRNGNQSYFDALLLTGAKYGRIFFPFTKCRNCDKYGLAYETIESLNIVLNLARDRNIKLILVGEFPGSDLPTFWSSTELQHSFVEAWRFFAKTFGNNTTIAGLDLLNEPVPPMPSGNVQEGHAQWRPLAEKAITAIRRENVSLPIIYEGIAGGSALGLQNFQPFNDSEIVYSIHFYTPHDITHQQVRPDSSWTRRIPYPAGPEWGLGKWDAEIGVTAWNRKRIEIELRGVIEFQHRYKVPIYVGEFSCIRWAPDNSRLRYIADCLAVFKKFGWSWTYHEFRGWPGWDAEIDSEDPTFNTRSSSSPLMNLLKSELKY